MSSPAIETRALTKRYGTRRGITDVDLVVERGEVFGFLGPNGAGKTTTIRILLDELHPTAGSARVLGLDTHRQAVEAHRRIGYLPDTPGLYERLTARQHLDWQARLRGAAAPDRDDLVERFALEVDRPIRDLSRGNRQKVGLVQAFMHRPEVVILDEPTSGLDPLMQEAFLTLVREVAAAGSTVFLSSHSLDEVQRVADRFAVLRDGALVAVRSVGDLEEVARRHVEVRFADPVTSDSFDDVAGITDVVLDEGGRRMRLVVTGDFDPLVGALAGRHVVDLVSRPPDLDELFLAFYRDDGQAATRGA